MRFLSAFVGVPILLALAVIGGWPYVLVVAGAAVVGMFEILSMLAGAGFRPVRLVSVALAVTIVLDALSSDVRLLPAILVIAVVGGLSWMMRRPDSSGALVDWALSVAPAIYVGGTLHYFIPLRSMP